MAAVRIAEPIEAAHRLKHMIWIVLNPNRAMHPQASAKGGREVSDDRFYSPLCEENDHEGCEKSSFIGICGCECHDHLDDLDEMLYGRGEGDTGKHQ